MWYIVLMKKQDPGGERLDLTKKVEVPEPPKEKWRPTEEPAPTITYANRLEVKIPPLEDLALARAREEFLHLPADDPVIIERAEIILAQWKA